MKRFSLPAEVPDESPNPNRSHRRPWKSRKWKRLRRLVICVLLVCCTAKPLHANFVVPAGLIPGDGDQIAFDTSGTWHAWNVSVSDDHALSQSKADLPGNMTEDCDATCSAKTATLDGFDAQTQLICGHAVKCFCETKVATGIEPPVLLFNPTHVNQDANRPSSLLWTGQFNFGIAPAGLDKRDVIRSHA